MKKKLTTFLSIALAGVLQIVPLVRSLLPVLQEVADSPTGSLIFKWAVGGVAFLGYHAVSSASSISISPATAILGVPYAGTITYSGGHAGGVVSMSISNTCLGSFTLAPGLTVRYNGGNTASVTGTPSGSIATVGITMTMWDFGGCTGGLTDTRSTSLIIQNTNGGPVAPSMLSAPQSVIAQVGSDVILSGGAGGNPNPKYYWQQGINNIPNATNNSLVLSNAQLTSAGIYTLNATNSQGKAQSDCYLTMAITPGNNPLALFYTNYVVAGTPVTMSSLITNVPSATNTYFWSWDSTAIPGATTNTLSLTAAQTIPAKSGTYTVTFNSKVGSTTVVNGQRYDSYWLFGYLPVVTGQPSGQNVNAGTNVTFNITLSGSSYPNVFLYQNQTNLVAQTNFSAYNPTSVSATTNISLTISNVTQANAGTYSFVVTNFWGSTTSSNATLTVISPLSVSAPQSQTNYAGKTVSLTVTPTGTAPFSYQWQNGGVNVSNVGNISGANTNTLSFAPAATTNSGNYQVIVTNLSGSVTSSVAVVSIVPIPQFGLSLASGNPTLSAPGGLPGSNYVVQVSTNLNNSAAWVPIGTNVVPSNGIISFIDTNLSNSGQRFYRVQFP
jgi:hypothetical protein